MKPTPSAQGKRHADAKRAEAPQHPAANNSSGAAVETASSRRRYALPDLRVGDPAAADPLAMRSWPELRELIYGGADVR